MSKSYENKANHNQDFLNSIINDYPESYFDWKVTVQFYIGLHKCYCVLLSKGILVTSSHQKNIDNIGNIDSDLSKKLFQVYKNSRQARYDGFISEDAMDRINKINFASGISNLNFISIKVAEYYPIQFI